MIGVSILQMMICGIALDDVLLHVFKCVDWSVMCWRSYCVWHNEGCVWDVFEWPVM